MRDIPTKIFSLVPGCRYSGIAGKGIRGIIDVTIMDGRGWSGVATLYHKMKRWDRL